MTADTRDELAAHRFRSRRMRSALLTGDPDGSGAPLSRLGAGVYGGILVTVLLLAVAGIDGVLRPGGSTAWQESGAFIVDDDTGARYVFLDGALHPMLNYASAKLLLGDGLHVVTVSGSSLDSAVRGPMLGIPMAPDSLPDATQIVGPAWSVCAVGRAADGDRLSTQIRPGVTAAGAPLDSGHGLLVRTEQGRSSMLWSGSAYPIADEWLPALGYHDAAPLLVDETFVAALPAGRPLAPPDIAGLGEPGPPLPGSSQPTTVGTIYADRTNASYVMTRDGLASLTPLQVQLLLADPALAGAYAGSDPTPLKVTQAQVTEAAPKPLPDPVAPSTSVPTGGTSAAPGPSSSASTPSSDPTSTPAPSSPAPAPTTAPTPADPAPGEQQFCARYTGGSAPDLAIGPAEPAPGGTNGPVRLAPGQGSLIAPLPGPEGTGGPIALVTDAGIRYPLADQRALESIGLAGSPIAQLPPALIAAMPVGPTLDRAAAAAPAG
ncbi:type VII secretion protein EccB [Nakamurella sp.]|uniref:type VII secretion protein EccB n=1 Tax=Nakamurella sp. TaxID=1869182 RepID=UPI00378366F9